MTLSIIAPVLNEGAIIRGFLGHLREVCTDAEVIVVDGGSTDGTLEISRELADAVVETTRGRAAQMNVGAKVSRGDVFWFVHADSVLPRDAAAEIRRALADGALAGGCFRVRYPRREWIYRISDSLGNLGVEIFGFALGDHGIFCRRECFEGAGGYPELPLMEDAELYRRLRRCGAMRQLPATIVADARRYEEFGPYRTTSYYFMILAAYVLGARSSTLVRLYNRLLARPRSPSAEARGSAVVPASR